MASIKLLKKKVQRIANGVMDDCDYIVVNNGKDAEKADKLIDEAVEFHHTMMGKIKAAKSKADYRAIQEELEKLDEEFTIKTSKLS